MAGPKLRAGPIWIQGGLGRFSLHIRGFLYSGCPGRAHYSGCAFVEPPSPLGNIKRAEILDLREVITEREAETEKKNRKRGGYGVLEIEAIKFADSCAVVGVSTRDFGHF